MSTEVDDCRAGPDRGGWAFACRGVVRGDEVVLGALGDGVAGMIRAGLVMLAEPVIVVVGNVPMSPPMVVGPVLVMPEPARTANPSAVPSGTALTAAAAPPTRTRSIPVRNTARTAVAHRLRDRRRVASDWRLWVVEMVIFGLRL